MCNSQIPWVDALPAVLHGLRTAYKEDRKASAEIVFGETLRIPGEFFIDEDVQLDPEIFFFLEKHKEIIRSICPTPAAHHTKTKMFIQKSLYECSHVFLRLDEVRPPYSGLHQVVKRIDDRRFIILINGKEATILVKS